MYLACCRSCVATVANKGLALATCILSTTPLSQIPGGKAPGMGGYSGGGGGGGGGGRSGGGGGGSGSDDGPGGDDSSGPGSLPWILALAGLVAVAVPGLLYARKRDQEHEPFHLFDSGNPLHLLNPVLTPLGRGVAHAADPVYGAVHGRWEASKTRSGEVDWVRFIPGLLFVKDGASAAVNAITGRVPEDVKGGTGKTLSNAKEKAGGGQRGVWAIRLQALGA